MTRPIKFRAWIEYKNYEGNTVDFKYVFPVLAMRFSDMGFLSTIEIPSSDTTELVGNATLPYFDYDHPETIKSGKIGHLMQFTGLHDKNGKEIYEGDIVRFINGNYPMDTEKIRNVGAIHYNETRAEYEVDRTLNLGDAGGHDLSFFLGFCELEVIGNIYENSELSTN